MKLNGTLVLVGAGKMGGAMLRGWLAGGLSGAHIAVFEPMPSEDLNQLANETKLRLNPELGCVDDVRATVFAVKPQAMQDVLPDFRALCTPDNFFVSIAAGKPVAFFEQIFGTQAPIVRAMPNTPAAIGRGISVLFANSHVTAAQRDLATALLSAVGEVAWIDDEALMDPVTAVSGSGPAYVFLLIETLANAGVEAGLDRDLAYRLAVATVNGAGELAATSDEPASVLRENVTSPGGTTAAALEILMAPEGMQALMTRAVAAATDRSRELAD